jgi:hypothetical protein
MDCFVKWVVIPVIAVSISTAVVVFVNYMLVL